MLMFFPFLGIAVFNILPTLSVTLDETDRLCAEQTSTAVGYSGLSLKFVWVVSKSPQNASVLLDKNIMDYSN